MSCKHYQNVLIEDDRHFVNSPEHGNCVLCLVEDRGAMTQEEVARYFGLSKMRICQIEKQAITKFNKKMRRFVGSEI